MQLTVEMQSAYNKLNTTVDQLSGFFTATPSPATLATSLTTQVAGLGTGPATTLSSSLLTTSNTIKTTYEEFGAGDANAIAYNAYLDDVRYVFLL
jgi:hypothetical protein